MKSAQRLGAAFVLTCALTLPAFAGIMDTGSGIAPPPPPTSPTTQDDMDTGSGVADAAGDSLTGAVLSLLEGVLALF